MLITAVGDSPSHPLIRSINSATPSGLFDGLLSLPDVVYFDAKSL